MIRLDFDMKRIMILFYVRLESLASTNDLN